VRAARATAAAATCPAWTCQAFACKTYRARCLPHFPRRCPTFASPPLAARVNAKATPGCRGHWARLLRAALFSARCCSGVTAGAHCAVLRLRTPLRGCRTRTCPGNQALASGSRTCGFSNQRKLPPGLNANVARCVPSRHFLTVIPRVLPFTVLLKRACHSNVQRRAVYAAPPVRDIFVMDDILVVSRLLGVRRWWVDVRHACCLDQDTRYWVKRIYRPFPFTANVSIFAGAVPQRLPLRVLFYYNAFYLLWQGDTCVPLPSATRDNITRTW